MWKLLDVLGLLKLQKDEISNCSSEIIELTKNFQNRYPELNNLKRYSQNLFDPDTITKPLLLWSMALN